MSFKLDYIHTRYWNEVTTCVAGEEVERKSENIN